MTFDFIPDFSWQTWAGIGAAAFVVAPRIVSGLVSTTILTGLAATAAVCFYIAGSTAIPLVYGSWQAHQVSIARSKGYDRQEVRDRIGPIVCPRYAESAWFEKVFRQATRELAWCAEEGRV